MTEITNPKEIFSEQAYKTYSQCEEYYPKLLSYLGHSTKTQCLLNTEKLPSLYFVESIEMGSDYRFFKACTLEEFNRKLILLDKVIRQESQILDNQTNSVLDIDSMFQLLMDEDEAFSLVKSDYTILVRAYEALEQMKRSNVAQSAPTETLH